MCLGIPGKVLSITGDDPLTRTAKVSFGGVVKDVSLACLPEAKVGDYVIVHVGFALSVVDEHEAHRVFEAFEQIEAAADAGATAKGYTATGSVQSDTAQNNTPSPNSQG